MPSVLRKFNTTFRLPISREINQTLRAPSLYCGCEEWVRESLTGSLKKFRGMEDLDEAQNITSKRKIPTVSSKILNTGLKFDSF